MPTQKLIQNMEMNKPNMSVVDIYSHGDGAFHFLDVEKVLDTWRVLAFDIRAPDCDGRGPSYWSTQVIELCKYWTNGCVKDQLGDARKADRASRH